MSKIKKYKPEENVPFILFLGYSYPEITLVIETLSLNSTS